MNASKTTYFATAGYRISHFSRLVEAGTEILQPGGLLGLTFIFSNDLYYKKQSIPAGSICHNHYNMVYLPQRMPHRFIIQHPGTYSALIVHFKHTYLKNFVAEFPKLKDFLRSAKYPLLYSLAHLPITEPMQAIISNILHNKDTASLKHDTIIDENIKDLVILSLRNIDSIAPFLTLSHPQLDIDRIREVHDHLLDNLEIPCCVGVLASTFNIEERRLEKGFKLCYGTTVYDFHLSERMKKARQLLCNTTIPVKDVAKKVGYKSVSSFSLVFKGKFGFAPRKAREYSLSAA